MGLRLFVCEYVTGGGLSDQPLPASLCREGDMMLGALVKDLQELPGVELVLTRDSRLPAPACSADIRYVENDPWRTWRRIAGEVDAVWPIAPETDAALERLSALVLDAGSRLIGSRPDAVRLAASKRATAKHLAAFGLPIVPSLPLLGGAPPELPAAPDGWVVKPDDGAGAEETRLFHRRDALGRWLSAVSGALPGNFVIQPYIRGEAASLSMLCRDGRARLLSCNSQHVRIEDGRFSYHGGLVGGLEHRRPVYERIARAVAEAMPKLWGHVGIDLVESAGGPLLLEVNPRLTTSYVGLRRAIGANPAALVLDLLGRAPDTDQTILTGEPCVVSVGGEDVR